MTRQTAEERFWSQVSGDDATGCWLWTGTLFGSGYGSFHEGKSGIGAHRWAWKHMVGEIPAGLVLDHLCRVITCVNPSHLEPVSQAENVLRGRMGDSRAAAECPEGHPKTAENTMRLKGRNDRGVYVCRPCRNEYQRSRRTRTDA